MPELLAYWLPIEHARILLRDMNAREGLVEKVEKLLSEK